MTRLPTTRRGLLVLSATTTAFTGSGCLDIILDNEENGDYESLLYLSNHHDVDHEVKVEITNLREGEVLVNETVTVTLDESIEFYFPVGEEVDGRYPDIRARVRMADNPENEDTKTRSFAPSADASLMADIEDTGEIKISVLQR